MKKLVFTTLVGLSLVGFTGCMSGIMSGKCMGSSKCESGDKCSSSGKCDGSDAAEEKKCASSGKCSGDSSNEEASE